MKKLHTFSLWERSLAGLLKERLEQEGVPCLLKNNDLVSLIGELPMVECYPELWVIDSETWPRARLLLEAWLRESADEGPDWTCPACHEAVEGGFEVCWNCGGPRPEER